jgi:4'-phosphopantetheinyl transferase
VNLDGETAAADSTLTVGVVHIWQIPLSIQANRIRDCRNVLSQDENQRADRFYFDRDRNRFIAARSAIRRILSMYVGVAPGNLVFCYGLKGKPELSPPHAGLDVKFSLSHSRDIGLLAVARAQSVGVDIEFVDYDFASDEVASRFFSVKEVDTWRNLSSSQKAGAFFSCWTRKEAYIKALGEGLSLPLDSFDVAFGPGVEAALLRVAFLPHESARWSMYNLEAPAGYAAALVIEGQGHRLLRRRWEPEF